MADRNYTVCYTCRQIWCDSRNCESPKKECQELCPECIDETNVHYDFCGKCKLALTKSFERQFINKLLPKRIRVEHDDAEAEDPNKGDP